MAFLRFTRDRRGYEQFSLVETATNRRGKSRSRLLYWYRTPPTVRVGREPFDESVRRALEAQNPGVQFDWRKIIETPIPSAETERWRERRRTEKAEKAALRAVSVEDEAQAESDIDTEAESEEPTDAIAAGAAPVADNEAATPAVETRSAAEPTAREAASSHPRRRRRGGRGRPHGAVQSSAPATTPESKSDPDAAPDLTSDSGSDLEPAAEPEGD